ncbi:MAG: hypothetical protein ACK4ME_03985, partial [Fimbriimonadales bacterium]
RKKRRDATSLGVSSAGTPTLRGGVHQQRCQQNIPRAHAVGESQKPLANHGTMRTDVPMGSS